jgi:site-specific recombinase XerD
VTVLHAVSEQPVASTWEALRGWDQWLSARGLSESTRRVYRGSLLVMASETLIDPLAMTESAFVAYLGTIPTRGSKRDSVVKAGRSFWGWCLKHEVIGANPAEELHAARPARGRAPSLTPQELRSVLRAAFRKDKRRGWGLMLLYATGARESSLAAVKVNDVTVGTHSNIRGQDLTANVATPPLTWWIEFRVAKGGNVYGLPLGRKGRAAVRWFLADAERESRDLLVGIRPRTFWEWCSQAGDAAGVRCWPHLLRHAYGTELAADPKIDLRTWMSAMGHVDSGQFARYAHARPNALREAMERF